jgi:RHS repeat-associated protein
MQGISDKALKQDYTENKYRFNGGSELANNEFSDGSGLEMYETQFRGYDPQIGRFSQIDPIAPIFDSWSPYQFAYDNPISYLDPFGADALVPAGPCVACNFPSIDPNSSTVVVVPPVGGQNSNDNSGGGQSDDNQSSNGNNLPYFQASFNYGQSGRRPERVTFSPNSDGGPRILPNSFRFKEP